MQIKEAVYDKQHLLIVLPDEGGQLEIVENPPSPKKNSVVFLIKNNQVIAVMDDRTYDTSITAERFIILTPTWDMMTEYLVQYYRQKYMLQNLEETMIPSEQVKNVEACTVLFDPLLDWMGYGPHVKAATEKKAPKAGKPQHKWSKELSNHPFYVDYQGSKATVYWQKRNQVRIEKGAILSQEIPLNKDGSIGFSARLSEKIRQDNQSAISGNRTIEEVILKSVNEMGMFLYYGNTNGWLVLKDDEGLTLNELTV